MTKDKQEGVMTRTPTTAYQIDFGKVKTLEDMKTILRILEIHITIHITNESHEYDELKHLLKETT
jgi:hypothetical protein